MRVKKPGNARLNESVRFLVMIKISGSGQLERICTGYDHP